MPKIKIPDSLKAFFRKEGIDDLARALQFLNTVSPIVVINTQGIPVQTFRGGRRIHKTISATAGNAIANLSPGADKRWLVIGGRIRIVADGNAANRIITLLVTDGTNEIRFVGATPNITTGQTRDLDFGEVKHERNAVAGNPGYGQNYLGIEPILVEGNDQFRIQIGAGLVGDSFSGYVTVLEIDI